MVRDKVGCSFPGLQAEVQPKPYHSHGGRSLLSPRVCTLQSTHHVPSLQVSLGKAFADVWEHADLDRHRAYRRLGLARIQGHTRVVITFNCAVMQLSVRVQ